MVSGRLQLRGSDPFTLESPTRMAGTNTDGQLTGVELSTPTVSTVRDVPDFNTTAAIDAAFSMVAPGTGSINEQGNVTVRLALAVDLHIEVPLLPQPSDCRAEPINLTLTSSVPYDPEAQRITLRAPNFSVPPVVTSSRCAGIITGPVNEALAGAGHSLTLTLAGAITPPPEGEPTTTSLAVAPEGGSTFGEEVTLTATVVPAPAVPGAPPLSGTVTFLDGDATVGTAEVGVDGTATLVTADLAAGPRELRAVYSGAPPDWDPSTSTATPYIVTAEPFVSTTAVGDVRIGGPGKDFDVTVVNTGFGAALADARLEVALKRQAGTGPIGPSGTTPRLVLDRVVGEGDLAPIALSPTGTGSSQALNGIVGDAQTWLVAPGGERTETLRLQVASGVSPGPLTVTFTLVAGEGATRKVLSTTSGALTMVDAARQATTLVAGGPGIPQLGVPPVPPITPVVRQGNVAELRSLGTIPTLSGVTSTGTFTFAVDGVPVPGQHISPSEPGAYAWQDVVRKAGATYLVKVPANTPVGTRQVTVRYSGDGLYGPSQAQFPITVEPSTGTVYECAGIGLATQQIRFTANVEVQATLAPAWPAGEDLPVDRVEVRLRLSRVNLHTNLLTSSPDEQELRLDLSDGATITPAALTSSNSTPPVPNDPNPPDRLVDLTGGTGSISVSSTPGAAVAYTLDTITVAQTRSGFASGFVCTSGATPYAVGTVTATGTTLVAEPGDVAAEGADVALTASALPAAPGVVEFRDGAETIGVVPVDPAGTARMVTDDLPAGTRRLTARFFGGVVATAPSAPVEIRIATCGEASEPGHGAVVRLVYLELLGRCPDPAGYAYWVDRLDGGASAEAFARSIARTVEAVGRVVDDAYRMVLGRPADAAGRTFWTRRLQANGRYDHLLADLAASAEFWAKAGSTNGGVVTRLYEQLLRRTPDQGGLDFWVGRLDDGVSRRALTLALANQSEPLGVLVDGAYDVILDRAPSASERTEGIAALRSTGDRPGLYARLIGTQELHDRAQGLPDPG